MILKFTRCQSLPLNLRRSVGKLLIKKDGLPFEIAIGSRQYRGCRDNYIEWLAYVTGDYFEYTYINLIRKIASGGAALDVGGNVGNHALAFSEIFETVYSVEPYPPVAARLEKRSEAAPNIKVFRVGLSDIDGTLRFAVPETSNWGTGSVSETGGSEIQVVVGDAFVKANVQEPLGFIKIDVEGHELNVLKGLRQTLAEQRPIVMFEVSRKAIAKAPDGLKSYLSTFPDDYQFAALSGQSTFPIQRSVAKATPLDRFGNGGPRKLCYIIAHAPERGLKF